MIKEQCKQIIWDWGKPGVDGDKQVRRGLIDLFEAISCEPGAKDLPSVTYILPCYDENSALEPGDWAPEIHLVLRKVENGTDNREQIDQSTGEKGEPGPAL